MNVAIEKYLNKEIVEEAVIDCVPGLKKCKVLEFRVLKVIEQIKLSESISKIRINLAAKTEKEVLDITAWFYIDDSIMKYYS